MVTHVLRERCNDGQDEYHNMIEKGISEFNLDVVAAVATGSAMTNKASRKGREFPWMAFDGRILVKRLIQLIFHRLEYRLQLMHFALAIHHESRDHIMHAWNCQV